MQQNHQHIERLRDCQRRTMPDTRLEEHRLTRTQTKDAKRFGRQPLFRLIENVRRRDVDQAFTAERHNQLVAVQMSFCPVKAERRRLQIEITERVSAVAAFELSEFAPPAPACT